MKLTKIMATSVAAVLAMSVFSLTAFAVDTNTITTAGTSATVPVSLTSEATVFSVTVPTQLAVAVSADGTVSSTTTSPSITNNGYAPVSISDVFVSPAEGWAMYDYDDMETDIYTLPVNSNYLALKINEEAVVDNGISKTSTFYSDGSLYFAAGETSSFDYTALVTARDSVESVQVATITFTFDWYTAASD